MSFDEDDSAGAMPFRDTEHEGGRWIDGEYFYASKKKQKTRGVFGDSSGDEGSDDDGDESRGHGYLAPEFGVGGGSKKSQRERAARVAMTKPMEFVSSKKNSAAEAAERETKRAAKEKKAEAEEMEIRAARTNTDFRNLLGMLRVINPLAPLWGGTRLWGWLLACGEYMCVVIGDANISV